MCCENTYREWKGLEKIPGTTTRRQRNAVGEGQGRGRAGAGQELFTAAKG